MSLRKSSSNRNGSKSEVLPKPNARRKCTPAPSVVGFDLINRLIGRMDISIFYVFAPLSAFGGEGRGGGGFSFRVPTRRRWHPWQFLSCTLRLKGRVARRS